tara:strand:+ start:1612 stop:1779 length:168 start_codon:yes stop_codon:yes gene_type:complete
MNITSAQYVAKEGENTCIKLTSNGVVSFAPLDPENTDYAAILKWVADGNTIAEAD